MEAGKWAVWKVDLWRRRVPPSLLGSVEFEVVSWFDYGLGRKRVGEGKRTFRVELEDLQVHVCV